MQIFIAGTMQGAQPGYTIIDQSYRADLQDVLRKHFVDCTIICSLTFLDGIFQAKLPQLIEMHQSRPLEPFLSPEAIGSPLTDVTAAFRELVRTASLSDLLVAYLPNRTPSMGTAMEMWAAFNNGVPVLSVTEMTQNLAVLSTSTVIVPSIQQLDAYLEVNERATLLSKSR